MAEESFNIKPDLSGNYVFVKDTWSTLAPVKFEPTVELDPCQAPSEDIYALDDFEDKFSAKIAGVHLASASSSAQSVDSVEVPPKSLGAATTPRQRRRPKGSQNWQRNPVVDPEALLEVSTPRKFAGADDNMALR